MSGWNGRVPWGTPCCICFIKAWLGRAAEGRMSLDDGGGKAHNNQVALSGLDDISCVINEQLLCCLLLMAAAARVAFEWKSDRFPSISVMERPKMSMFTFPSVKGMLWEAFHGLSLLQQSGRFFTFVIELSKY